MTASTESRTARTVATAKTADGLGVRDLILIAVLLAAGAVLKLTVGTVLSMAGVKPNFMIAMYCLAIILIRPKLYQAVIIGLLTGIISQIPLLNATPLVNLASETLGALVCGLLSHQRAAEGAGSREIKGCGCVRIRIGYDATPNHRD